MPIPKVSVIIPVYNVEQYIERCARSLFEQTLDDIEYIFVDDKTPDKSMEILHEVLKEYPNRVNQVKIIEMPVNSKVAAARTAGMKAATGEYMIHCDPDDWVELDMYENMLKKAEEKNADVVLCKALKSSPNKIQSYYYSDFEGTGKECLGSLKFEWSLCTKLVKSKIIKQYNIYPFEGFNCGEDLNTIIRILYYAHKVTTINIPYYHYEYNPSSITNNNNTRKKVEGLIKNLELISVFLDSCDIKNKEYIIKELSFMIKSPLIWTSGRVPFRDLIFFKHLWRESHLGRKKSYIYDSPILLFLYRRYLRLRGALNGQ